MKLGGKAGPDWVETVSKMGKRTTVLKLPASRVTVVILVTTEGHRNGPREGRFRRAVALHIYRRIRGLIPFDEARSRIENLGGLTRERLEHPKALVQWRLLDQEVRPNAYQTTALETEAQRLGYRIRMRRLGAGLSQRELAKRAGLTASQICRIERGCVEATEASLARLDEALRRAQLESSEAALQNASFGPRTFAGLPARGGSMVKNTLSDQVLSRRMAAWRR